MATVLDMMKELLEDEVSRVMKSRNLTNFFSTPAPFEVWERWEKLAQERPSEIGEMLLNLKDHKVGSGLLLASTKRLQRRFVFACLG